MSITIPRTPVTNCADMQSLAKKVRVAGQFRKACRPRHPMVNAVTTGAALSQPDLRNPAHWTQNVPPPSLPD